MSMAFADSDFAEAEESQLTLGTTSLLSIFFGLVMICGIFFGLGYSLGRRGLSQLAAEMAAMKQPTLASPAKSTVAPTYQAAQPMVQQASTAVTGPSADRDPVDSHAEAAPALTAVPALTPAATPRQQAVQLAPVPIKELIASKHFLPKPSAIHPVTVQPDTDIPYANEQASATTPLTPGWHWTPPFDVHPHGAQARVVHTQATVVRTSAAPVNRVQPLRPSLVETRSLPAQRTAMIVQIAALSREDDAQVLADALRKRGFVASIRNGEADSLYHVQVGPFERRIALATQQRLIARGYNAVVK